jgi:hypothetical protein
MELLVYTDFINMLTYLRFEYHIFLYPFLLSPMKQKPRSPSIQRNGVRAQKTGKGSFYKIKYMISCDYSGSGV